MSFEETNFEHLSCKGEKVYGDKPSPEEIKKRLEAAIKADAELAERLSEKKNVFFPGPSTVNPKIAEAFRDSLEEMEEKKLGKVIEFPEGQKPPVMEKLEKKKVA